MTQQFATALTAESNYIKTSGRIFFFIKKKIVGIEPKPWSIVRQHSTHYTMATPNLIIYTLIYVNLGVNLMTGYCEIQTYWNSHL